MRGAARKRNQRLLMVESAQESLTPSSESGTDLQLLRKLVPFARPHAWLFVGALGEGAFELFGDSLRAISARAPAADGLVAVST